MLIKLKKLFADDEFRFKFMIGLEFMSVSLVFAFGVLMYTLLLVKIDLVFFISNGFPGVAEVRDAYYSYVYASLSEDLPYIILALFAMFGIGYYLGSVMIRPFKLIGDTCEDRMNNKINFYHPDMFSDLKLLTSFTSYFFSKTDLAKETGKLQRVDIPEAYTKIHKPIFEKTFFLNYFFILIIFALLASYGIVTLNESIREQILELSDKFLSNNKQAKFFLEGQFAISDIAIYFAMFIHTLIYVGLGFHLYGKVATPAFAVFATMRSFLKGNYYNRIHLVGYYYLREHCRKINKYLDHVQKNLTDPKNQE